MNTQNTPSEERPLGYWLTATDRLLAAEFARVFENEDITRRDWRLLNAIDGDVPTGRPIDDRKLGRLIERGWIAAADDGWSLTEDGRAAKERLRVVVDGIRATIAEAVSSEEYATTIASLAAMARALGWDENTPLPRKNRGGRGHRGNRGHGPRHGHPFGRFVGHAGEGHGFDHGGHEGHGRRSGRPEFAGDHAQREAHDGRPHAGHGHGAPHSEGRGQHGRGGLHRRVARMAQHAYERGFDAGFERGSTVR
ncbi:MarR family winged helix-turn-helix transcriptional regulator [Microbacterium sp. GXF0217]